MQKDAILFNLIFEINGKPIDCGVKKWNKDAGDCYTVCTHIDGELKEFPLHYNAEARGFFFKDDNIPQDLKSAEMEISDAIHTHAKSDLLDFMSNHSKDENESFEQKR